MHTALVSRLIKDRSAWELAHVPFEEAKADETPAKSVSANLSAAVSTPALAGI
jgi:hypothetical protein